MSFFGQNATGNSGTSNSFFGNQQQPATGSGSAFGGGGDKPVTPNLFGTPSTPASGGLFGQPNAPPATSAFGALGSNAVSSTPAAGQTGGLFGSSNLSAPSGAPAPTGGTSNIFGAGMFGPARSANPNPVGTTPQAGINPLFGGTSGGSLFGGGNNTSAPGTTSSSTPANSFFGNRPAAPATATPSAPAVPSGGLFGQTAATSTNTTGSLSTAPAPTPGGFFALPSKPADPQGATAAPTSANSAGTGPAAPSGGLFGGGFGTKPATTTSGGASTTTPAAPTLPTFNLGGNKDAPKDTGSTTTSGTAGPSLFNLGGTKPEEKKDDKKDGVTPTSTFNLFGSTEKKTDVASTTTTAAPGGSGAAAASTSTAGAPTISVAPPSVLRGKTIEEIVNRWSTELETHVKEFNKFASEVAVWDRTLIENGNSLAQLYALVLSAEREQNDIDQSLDHIEQQQRDLAATLDAYEKTTEEILGGQSSSLRALDTGPADTERDKNYMLATELHGHLDDLSGSLMQMIESVNALSISTNGVNGQPQDGEDPMGQIAQILSSHLESLQWIDGAVRELDTKVSDVERRVRVATDGGFGSGTKSRGFGLR